MTTDTPERRETPEETAEREAREAAEALAARAAEIAAMDDADLTAEATDAELKAEDQRLATLPRPSTRAITTIPRARGHERLRIVREGLPGASAGALQAAARGAAKVDGPSIDDLRRAFALHQLARAGEEFWTALAAVVDGPAPAGMAEVFSDDDPAAEARAELRRTEARRNAISRELEAREVARRAAQHPGMVARIAALAKGRRA